MTPRLLPLVMTAALVALSTPATAADEVWAGPAHERDDYNPGTTLHTAHPYCESTVGVAVLTHIAAGWRFYTVNDDCVGFDHAFADDECETDGGGVMTCNDVPAPPGISVSLLLTPEGHVTVDFVGAGTFAGGHYHVEGDLTRL